MISKNEVRLIKKYANRKLYDTAAKTYITQRRVADLIKAGEPVRIVDHVTGEDLTAAVVARLLGREDKFHSPDAPSAVPTGVLVQLLRKGGDTLTGYAHKYTSMWHNDDAAAEGEADGRDHFPGKSGRISAAASRRLTQDLLPAPGHLKAWIGAKIDQRVNDVLGRMHLVTKGQVADLARRINALNHKVDQIEKTLTAGSADKRYDAE